MTFSPFFDSYDNYDSAQPKLPLTLARWIKH